MSYGVSALSDAFGRKLTDLESDREYIWGSETYNTVYSLSFRHVYLSVSALIDSSTLYIYPRSV